ncbi:Nif3-like dinuclear metal center hexameric protein [Candidatus Profftella armatura]|jgi:dinuclear metal center protein, YbgI/SA1388 family|nr:Nif3-like dinuclear metal center hexameric protein [Candidatus Profftella armatura]ALC96128.1 metal-binding protein [Candidatus Profftella armatura]QLK13768.1 Nif3-like dinuclear metal center hexameric protein [Candidatus Profftella armatura]
MINRDILTKFLEKKLNIKKYEDYCPNGLQVEGRSNINVIVTGVTASLDLIKTAVDMNADAILVHHGYFWKGENSNIVGIKKKRLEQLIINKINLYAYHLPLDMHPKLGNNAQLAKILNFSCTRRFSKNNIGWIGKIINLKRYNFKKIITIKDLFHHITRKIGKKPIVIGDLNKKIYEIGWCTGAAQNLLTDAINEGVTAYISGEISESTVYISRESGVAYFAAGHHATERYGIKALGEYLEKKFKINHYFIDIDNII